MSLGGHLGRYEMAGRRSAALGPITAQPGLPDRPQEGGFQVNAGEAFPFIDDRGMRSADGSIGKLAQHAAVDGSLLIPVPARIGIKLKNGACRLNLRDPKTEQLRNGGRVTQVGPVCASQAVLQVLAQVVDDR